MSIRSAKKQHGLAETVKRRIVPTYRDFKSKDGLTKTELELDLPATKEVAWVRRKDIVTSRLLEVFEKEAKAFSDYCATYPSFEGLYILQRTLTGELDQDDLEALDHIQAAGNSSTRFIHQRTAVVPYQEAINRITQYAKDKEGMRLIPVIDMEMAGKNQTTQKDLMKLIHSIRDHGITEICFIFRSSKKVRTNWLEIFRPVVRQLFDEIYFSQTDFQKNGTYGLLGAFLYGGTKAIQKRGRPPRKKIPPAFLEKNWSITTKDKMSDGVVTYSIGTRKDYVKKETRVTYIQEFARFDRLLQAQRMCESLEVERIEDIPHLKEAIKNFL